MPSHYEVITGVRGALRVNWHTTHDRCQNSLVLPASLSVWHKFHRHGEVKTGAMTYGGLAPDVAVHCPGHELDVRQVAAHPLHELLPLNLVLFWRHKNALDISLGDDSSLVIKFKF